MTRSLGDNVAKRLGVVATPEVVTYKLTLDDRCVRERWSGGWGWGADEGRL